MMRKKKIVLICVAHRDDETIGCGGTIVKHYQNGDKIYCLSFTDGVSARNNIKDKNVIKRKKNSINASKILKFKWIDHNENFDDNQLDKYPLIKLIKLIEKVKSKINPDIVYTHFIQDLNIDHQIVSRATLTAFRPLKNEKCKKIIFFEVPSSTDYSNYVFKPNYFVDITQNWAKKKSALKCYKKEILKQKSSRDLDSLFNLAKIRGSLFCFLRI
jgi:LmbE family N-acetylglucosaminyl deacetylase|tara:strand:+ start:102 stop:746 length:645 start_codon:yes stop_codon:yes gene_type:complete